MSGDPDSGERGQQGREFFPQGTAGDAYSRLCGGGYPGGERRDDRRAGLPPAENEDVDESLYNQSFVDRSALLRATLNSLAMSNVASVLNANKHKKKLDDIKDDEKDEKLSSQSLKKKKKIKKLKKKKSDEDSV